MTEEEKKAAEEAAAAAQAAEAAETPEEKAARKTKASLQAEYEAELKREREAREKAETALKEQRFKESEAKRLAGDDDDKPLTARQLEEVLARERQGFQKELHAQRIETRVRELAGSGAEAALIVEVYKNRTFPSHLSVEEQVEEAFVIANRKKILGERDEALRALRGKEGVNNDAAGTYHDQPTSPLKIAPDMKTVLIQQGFTENRAQGHYEKKLSGGRILIADPKTGQIRFV